MGSENSSAMSPSVKYLDVDGVPVTLERFADGGRRTLAWDSLTESRPFNAADASHNGTPISRAEWEELIRIWAASQARS